ncbi:MAG: NAD(P)-dependent glycerol-3-phosphate dehydrogenase [Armatimonadetes bacterium]|nr:NAD(P)-dependent glycerol-3-phosphate dehydrogenase [Armatimonadota bacterium]
MSIAVIGSGSWGTALAVLLGKKGYAVRLWSRREELAKRIASERENSQYLPGVALPETVNSASSLDEALDGCDTVVLAVPSTGMREVIRAIKGKVGDDVLIVHAGKGLESKTGLRGSEVIAQELGTGAADNCVVLSGPNLAVELAHDVPTATVVASHNPERAARAQELFSSPSLRVYRNTDLIGVEMGGSLKNVLAIGAGISDGLGYGDNTKATLITRGLMEITRLGTALGADPKTFIGLSGIGDLMATSTSRLSRNNRLGLMLGQGKGLDESLAILGQVAEGMHTCEAAYFLSKKHDVYMPITEQIYAILFEGRSPKQGVYELMSKMQKDELS